METEQMEKGRCFVCGATIEIKPVDPNEVRPPYFAERLTCWHCRKTYPPSLIKACGDSFHYTLRIRGIRDEVDFTRAKINGNWVTLYNEDNRDGVFVDGEPYLRGYDVALSEITGCSDAPDIPFSIRKPRVADTVNR